MWARRRWSRVTAGVGAGFASAGLFTQPLGGRTIICEQNANNSDAEPVTVESLKLQIENLKEEGKRLKSMIPPVEPTVQEKEFILRHTKKTIAIFGGSFDPITNAHLTSACEILHHR